MKTWEFYLRVPASLVLGRFRSLYDQEVSNVRLGYVAG
jgi:hypothetical protein